MFWTEFYLVASFVEFPLKMAALGNASLQTAEQSVTVTAYLLDNSSLQTFLKINEFFTAYIIPVFFFAGLLGNVMSIVVFYKYKKKDIATVQYLTPLSISDASNLILVTLHLWISDGLSIVTNGKYRISFNLYSNVACKAHRFLMDTSQFLSGYILVVFSAERCFAIVFPLKGQAIITPTRRRLALLGLFLLSLAWNVKAIPLTTIYVEPSGRKSCYLNPYLISPFILLIFSTVHFLLNNFLPCLLIMTLNIFLSLAMWRSTRSSALRRDMSDKEVRCVWNLVAVSFLYVVTMSPQVITWTYYNMLKLTIYERGSVSQSHLAGIFTMGRSGMLFSTVNYSLNFIIYCISLDFYKDTLRSIFCVCVNISAEQKTRNTINTIGRK
jgi:hypothetical protein